MRKHLLHRLIFFIGAIALFSKINAQDIITKTDGTSIQANVSEITENEVKYKKIDNPAGPNYVLSLSLIDNIKYRNGTIDSYKKNASAITKNSFSADPDYNNHKQSDFSEKYFDKKSNEPPLIESFILPKFKIFGPYVPKNEFAKTNPDYTLTGKYFYDNTFVGIGACYGNSGYLRHTFNYYDFPSKYTYSSKTFSENQNILILFSGLLPLETSCLYFYKECRSSFKLNNLEAFRLEPDAAVEYDDVNSKYKEVVSNIFKLKGAKKVQLANMYENKSQLSDDFQNTYIFEFKVLDLIYFIDKKGLKNWPDYIQYQLNILTPNGNELRSYKQCVFFESERSQGTKMHKYSIEYIRCSLNYAISSLLNQFLNDKEANDKLNKYFKKQSIDISNNNLFEFSIAQSNLFELRQNKKMIIDELIMLGSDFDGVTNGKIIDPNSIYIYNSSTSKQMNQNANDVGQLTVGVVNLLQANKERKRLEWENSLVSKLKLAYQKIDIEEKELTKNLHSNILNSPAVLYLPNNSELNGYMIEQINVLEQKSEKASNMIDNKFEQNNNNLNSQNTQIVSRQNSQGSSESVALTSSNKDGNSPEGIACSKEAKSQWEASKEYHDFYDNRNNINSPQLRNGELSKAKYADILLQHCSQYLSEAEKAALTTTRDNCIKNANEMKGNTINPK